MGSKEQKQLGNIRNDRTSHFMNSYGRVEFYIYFSFWKALDDLTIESSKLLSSLSKILAGCDTFIQAFEMHDEKCIDPWISSACNIEDECEKCARKKIEGLHVTLLQNMKKIGQKGQSKSMENITNRLDPISTLHWFRPSIRVTQRTNIYQERKDMMWKFS